MRSWAHTGTLISGRLQSWRSRQDAVGQPEHIMLAA